MNKVKQKDLLLYSGLIILGLAAPFLFPGFKVQLTILCVLIVLAMTWNLKAEKWVIILLEIFFFTVLECI